MRQDAQKPARKFCGSKEEKNSETHPEKPEKGETGCVLGAGAGGSGWRRMKLGEKGRYRAGKGGDNSPITWRKWRDGLELASQALLRCPALSAAAGPPCQSPTAAPSPPRCIRHRRRFGGDARHAPRASVSPTAITKNSATANAVALFLCFLSKNDASDQKRGKKNQDLCGFQAFLLFEIVRFPKKMWKTGGAILMRKSENYHAMLGW